MDCGVYLYESDSKVENRNWTLAGSAGSAAVKFWAQSLKYYRKSQMKKSKYEMMSKVAILSLYAHILVAQMTNEFLIYIAYLSSIIYSSTYLNVEIWAES